MPDPEGNTPDLRISDETAAALDRLTITPASALSVEPEPTRQTTRYEVSLVQQQEVDGAIRKFLMPLGVVEAASGPAALKAWYLGDQDMTSNARLRAVPVRNITEQDVTVEKVERVKFT